MVLRGRSKERDKKFAAPGPVYMSNEEFAEYLRNLRNNRIARPSDVRKIPSNSATEHHGTDSSIPVSITSKNRTASTIDLPPRSTSAFSHRRTHSSLSNSYSSLASHTGRQLVKPPAQDLRVPLLKPSEVVPCSTYIERGQRWMEKEEAVALREAMEEMDMKEEIEDLRIHAAAQKEASELVWQFEYPDSVAKPDQPYRYNHHLKKNSYQYARTQSASRSGASTLNIGRIRDSTGPLRSVSGESSSSDDVKKQRGRVTNGSSDFAKNISNESADCKIYPSKKSPHQAQISGDEKQGDMAFGSHTLRRKSSARRNISGEIISGAFSGDQIWQEKSQENQHNINHPSPDAVIDIPVPLRIKPKNPLNRVQFAPDMGPRSSSTPPEPKQRISTHEIHKNPPSQSRNPRYIENPPPKLTPSQGTSNAQSSTLATKDGLEIRSDEIRQATSMRLKDRSPKLPTPTIVSDKPGRPIVSFDSNWKPKEADVKPEVRRSPFDRHVKHNYKKSELPGSASKNFSTNSQTSVDSGRTSALEVNIEPATSDSHEKKLKCSGPPIPSIVLSDPIPTVIVNSQNSPSISAHTPSGSVTPKDIPLAQSKRPLPTPRSSQNHSVDQKAIVSQGHWSPAAGKRATATCHRCRLPIEGRILKISDTMEHYHPECFKCFTCGTGLESLEIHPEPTAIRIERIDRIRRRAQGQYIPDTEGQTIDEDGDERQRYYCHLDFHEKFSPRCKHCKTPIIGEHLIALGEHWHHGHFFCAECGDPFEKGMTHIEKDGYAWCLRCQTQRTKNRAPKCQKCKESVIGEYVRALGGEWHERCFRCAVCNNGFDDGAFYPKETHNGTTTVMCTKCLELELKA